MLDAAGKVSGDYGWIGPTYQTTERGVDAVRIIAPPEYAVIRGTSPRYADVLGGRSRVFFLSGDNADNIRGYGFRGIIIDEAPYIGLDAWNYVIRPTISQTQGWAALYGTPKGRNWFYDMWTRGQDANEPQYDSFTFPSSDNPYFPASEIALAKATLPDIVFRQEYLAEFLEDSAGVFTGIGACIRDQDCTCGCPPVTGVDLAKHQDFTVAIVMCPSCGHCLRILRFNKIDWPEQKERLKTLAAEYRGRMYIDSTGVGDPIFDDLKKAGVPVEGFKFSNPSKVALVQGLMVAIEQSHISWPTTGEQWECLTNELRRYEYKYSKTGTLTYNAPEGYHDDCVIALGLCVYGTGARLNPHIWGGGLPNDEEQREIEITKLLDELPADEREAMRRELGL